MALRGWVRCHTCGGEIHHHYELWNHLSCQAPAPDIDAEVMAAAEDARHTDWRAQKIMNRLNRAMEKVERSGRPWMAGYQRRR